MIIGFLSLRELAEARPPVRQRALQTLLQFCTHPDRKVRVIAITTVRRWVPNTPMSASVVAYALGVLRRLAVPTEGTEEDAEMAEGAVESKFLTDVQQDTVSQHVELAFALSRRDQDLLDSIFSLYPKLAPEIQDTVGEMLKPLVKSLGPTAKLLEILRNFPPGADKLALLVLKTLSAEGSSRVLVGVIRSLMAERELDPRFIIPVIGELDKVGRTMFLTDPTGRNRESNLWHRLSPQQSRRTRCCPHCVCVCIAETDSRGPARLLAYREGWPQADH